MFLPFRELISINHRDIGILSIQPSAYYSLWKFGYREFQLAILERDLPEKEKHCIKFDAYFSIKEM